MLTSLCSPNHFSKVEAVPEPFTERELPTATKWHESLIYTPGIHCYGRHVIQRLSVCDSIRQVGFPGKDSSPTWTRVMMIARPPV